MGRVAGSLGILLCLAAANTEGAAPSKSLLTVAVSVQNNADVSAMEIATAQAVPSDIYAAIGVRVEWGAAADKGLRLVIVRSAITSHLAASDDALGLTPADLTGPGRRAYVFEDRVRASLRELHMEFGQLLGCAMAHELGHMLLPLHAHSDTGIMRGFWDAAHLSVAGSDYLHFTPWQERMIAANRSG